VAWQIFARQWRGEAMKRRAPIGKAKHMGGAQMFSGPPVCPPGKQ